MEVSAIAAFIAGLVSFLSPCVLPLVPGYISMLSGIGVDQLQQGQQPRSSLFGSSLAFVGGFSVVFISFGASASAAGQFLVRNRNLLAPLAGALIVLFGLHLVGWLGRFSIRTGLAIGAALAAAAVVLWLRPVPSISVTGRTLGPVHLVSISLIFFAGPFLTRWLNRDIHFRHLCGQRLPDGLRLRVWLDALHRAHPGRRADHGGRQRDDRPRGFPAGRLFRRAGHPVSPDRAGHQPLPAFLPALPPPPADCGGLERRAAVVRRRAGFHQPADLAFG